MQSVNAKANAVANVKAKSKCGFASKHKSKSGLQANANVRRKYKVLHSAISLAQTEVSKNNAKWTNYYRYLFL